VHPGDHRAAAAVGLHRQVRHAHQLVNPLGLGQSAGYQAGRLGWVLVALLITTGLLALIALTRAGIRHFWATHDRAKPELRVLEGAPIAGLMALCVALTMHAHAVMASRRTPPTRCIRPRPTSWP
jgi:formate hydrogenlyase subunit 3/multisubunit Na+/H+ antiporter MnhD subunit